MGKICRGLTEDEILQLKSQSCLADDWGKVFVAEDFTTEYVHHTRFSGEVKLGVFQSDFTLPGGIKKHAGLRHVTLHNVTVGDNCCIENIQNYIANYEIGDNAFIENVDIILVDGRTTFGNGVEVAVLNETGGREVLINDKLSAHQAYILALYRHRPELIDRMKKITDYYSNKHASTVGTIGNHVMILNTGSIKNVRIGDCCHICGTCRLSNGSVNSNAVAPVHIGHGVICDDFIISSGSHVDDGALLTRCFVGQACQLGHNYSASDSLFFSNCQGENGEACAIFAGPYTVTHHKSTLLIAGMFSFMNAGSGSNQSNHMYKLGPIHQGTLERGAKTTSDSYILWPARVGAFSLVMGRHVNHADTSNLPFSYLIEQQNITFVVLGVNLRSVGTIRDAQKWPKRDKRKDPNKLDYINYNLLSPYTIQKMFKGRFILKDLKRVSGETSETYSYQSAKIKNSSLNSGIRYYEIAIHKFLGNSIIKRLEGIKFQSNEEIRQRLKPDTEIGLGEWVDISGLIAPKSEIEKLMAGIESGEINRLKEINARFAEMHNNYYTYEWTWAYNKIQEFKNFFDLVGDYAKVGYAHFDALSRDGYALSSWYRNIGEEEGTPLPEIIGIHSHFHPEDRAVMLDFLDKVIKGESSKLCRDMRIRRADGNYTWTRVNVLVRNYLPQDNIIEMLCINFDMTQLKETERMLIEAKEKAEESDRLKSAFLANMSHEIRTPLNAIVGFSSMLQEADNPEEKLQYVTIIEENNKRLLQLISDILDLSKIEAGTFDFTFEKVNAKRLCNELYQAMQMRTSPQVELRLSPDLPDLQLTSDKSRLYQVLSNFVVNALKFTSEGSITISYQIKGKEAKFSVEDTGIGIEPEKQTAVFNRFVKLNNFIPGTGLGLSICQSIITQLGGKIGVDSEPGKGSCFWFTHPLG